MKKSDVITYYGSKAKAAVALGLGKPAVTEWPEDLPIKTQCFIELATKGKLKADRELLKETLQKRQA